MGLPVLQEQDGVTPFVVRDRNIGGIPCIGATASPRRPPKFQWLIEPIGAETPRRFAA